MPLVILLHEGKKYRSHLEIEAFLGFLEHTFIVDIDSMASEASSYRSLQSTWFIGEYRLCVDIFSMIRALSVTRSTPMADSEYV
jgi:hypothetical protein